jgi:very-short-patch-repair endonuclease
LGSIRNLTEAVVAIDMALHAGLVDLPTLQRYTRERTGQKGVKRLRRSLGLAEPRTESPMETRLRLALIAARLPRPCVQAELNDSTGRFLARADLYYPDRRLVIEYDGQNHAERLVPDLRRQNALLEAGYHVLRLTAADLQVTGLAADQVRRARARLAKPPG